MCMSRRLTEQTSLRTSKSSFVERSTLSYHCFSVRFAPISQPAGETYTSPSLRAQDRRVPRAPVRQPTVSERITARLREFRLNASTQLEASHAEPKPEVQFDADAEEKGTPKLDKGKGRALDPDSALLASPPPLSPPLPPAKLVINPAAPPSAPPIMVAGVSFTAQELSDLLTRAKAELPLRAVRFPLLGEYQDAFTGEEFTTWLRENVKAFDGNLDRAEDAARELTEKQGLLRRLGELGNEYEDADDAFYQFRQKVSLQLGGCHQMVKRLVLNLFRHSIWKHLKSGKRSCCRRLRRISVLWQRVW